MDVSCNKLRQNLKHMIDLTSNTHEPLIVTSRHKRKAVLLAYEDYKSLEETVYLLKSPAMTKRLTKRIAAVKAGKVIKRELINVTDNL